MLTSEQVMVLIQELESDHVERTVALKDTDKFSKAICAFSNDLPQNRKPGVLIIGATEEGKLSGLKVTDQMLQDLAAIRSDGNIQPLPILHVSRHSFQEGDVAVVEVTPSDLTPVRYRGQVWIRVGPRRAIASEQEERILTERRVAQAKTFDARACVGASLEALILDLFLIQYREKVIAPEIIAENHRDIYLQLASLRFFDLHRQCPTYAGILMFGKDLISWMPGAYIQFVRFAGDTLATEVKAEKKICGNLTQILSELDTLLDTQIEMQPVAETTLREKTISDYPKTALREILMNAILHRSYESNAPIRFYWFDHHVEIQSPGGLYGEASPENFPYQNDYRNPVLAEAMRALGYVNRYGRGVIRAQEALRDNGNPPALFTFDPHFVKAVMQKP